MNGIHDMGGMHGFGPIEPRQNEDAFHAEWEKRVNAIIGAVRPGLFNIDEFRHGIERIPPDRYLTSTYYERWLATLETNLVEKGVLTRAEIDARATAFGAGTATEVRREDPAMAERVVRERMLPGTP